jgi:hypothetical protein
MFRKQIAEILRRRLKLLDKLDETEVSDLLVSGEDLLIPSTDFFDRLVDLVLLKAYT